MEACWRTADGQQREVKEVGWRGRLAARGERRLAGWVNVDEQRGSFVLRSFYDYDCDTSINGQLQTNYKTKTKRVQNENSITVARSLHARRTLTLFWPLLQIIGLRYIPG